jgi:hypothetical protein
MGVLGEDVPEAGDRGRLLHGKDILDVLRRHLA